VPSFFGGCVFAVFWGLGVAVLVVVLVEVMAVYAFKFSLLVWCFVSVFYCCFLWADG